MSEPPAFDVHALIARVRAGDDAARKEAFQRVFGNELGRVVLAHIAADAGVGGRFGGVADLYSLGYHQGGHDLALELIEDAGFDQASVIAMVMTGQLEGTTDERSAGGGYAEPDPEF